MNHPDLQQQLQGMSLQEFIQTETTIRRLIKKRFMELGGVQPLAPRPDWDTYYLGMAYVAAGRGACLRRKVGALIIAEDHSLMSTGYNGKGSGLTNCEIDPCRGATAQAGQELNACEAVHAEINALMKFPDRAKAHTLYVTCSPCTSCVDILLGSRISRIVFLENYPGSEESQRRWEKAGRVWSQYKEPEENPQKVLPLVVASEAK